MMMMPMRKLLVFRAKARQNLWPERDVGLYWKDRDATQTGPDDDDVGLGVDS